MKLLLLFWGTLLLIGCNSKTSKAHEQYEDAWRKTKLGYLGAALRETDTALSESSDLESEWHWRFLTLKAEILMREGLYEESLSLLDFSLPSKLQNSEVAVWQGLTQGAALAYLERFANAQSALDQARALAESHQPQLVGEAILRLGTLATLRWDLLKAQANYHKALELAEKQKDGFLQASALGSLGMIATRLERYDESVDWNKRALRLAQSLSAMSLVAKIEGNIAWSYYVMGDFENALALNKDTERDARLAELHQSRVLSLTNSAVVYYDMHDFVSAEAASESALTLARNLNDASYIVDCLQNHALVALGEGQFGRAQQDLDEAARWQRSIDDRPSELYTRLLVAKLAASNGKDIEAERGFSALKQEQKVPTWFRWEAQAGLAEVHAAQGKNAAAEREFIEAISTIAKAQRELQHEEFRLSFLSSAIRFYNAYVDFLIAQHRPGDALGIAERSRAQTLTAGLTEPSQELVTSFPRVDVQQLAARFQSTLLFYSLGTPHSHLWVITPQKTTLLSLAPQSKIDPLIKSYRDEVLDSGSPLETPNSPASKLYSMLVQPAAKLIPPDSRVILFPDGALNSLNFETLIVPGPAPHYWIQDATLTTANSLTLLQRSQSTPPPPDARLFLVGDPISSDEQFPPLRQAAREMAFVKGYFPEDHRRVLAGKDATPPAYLSAEPERFDYLHFVTHGTASSTHPLDSAVILTKAGDSEKLYAHEIITRPLHAYLVTVSACDGIGKRTYAGEGLVGLSWAFLRAGAHNVIASLWEVNDDSTPQLMDELYKGLSAGQDPATALRNAKLSLVHSEGNFRKPFYWAPFQLYAGS
jgi:CHAT domain-containing protein